MVTLAANLDMTVNHKTYGVMNMSFQYSKSIKRIIWDYKSKKLEM